MTPTAEQSATETMPATSEQTEPTAEATEAAEATETKPEEVAIPATVEATPAAPAVKGPTLQQKGLGAHDSRWLTVDLATVVIVTTKQIGTATMTETPREIVKQVKAEDGTVSEVKETVVEKTATWTWGAPEKYAAGGAGGVFPSLTPALQSQKFAAQTDAHQRGLVAHENLKQEYGVWYVQAADGSYGARYTVDFEPAPAKPVKVKEPKAPKEPKATKTKKATAPATDAAATPAPPEGAVAAQVEAAKAVEVQIEE